METAQPSPAGWSPEQIEQGKRMVHAWKEVGEVMERLRFEDLRATDTPKALELLAGAFESARFMKLDSSSSGFVLQQELFMKWRKASLG